MCVAMSEQGENIPQNPTTLHIQGFYMGHYYWHPITCDYYNYYHTELLYLWLLKNSI